MTVHVGMTHRYMHCHSYFGSLAGQGGEVVYFAWMGFQSVTGGSIWSYDGEYVS